MLHSRYLSEETLKGKRLLEKEDEQSQAPKKSTKQNKMNKELPFHQLCSTTKTFKPERPTSVCVFSNVSHDSHYFGLKFFKCPNCRLTCWPTCPKFFIFQQNLPQALLMLGAMLGISAEKAVRLGLQMCEGFQHKDASF